MIIYSKASPAVNDLLAEIMAAYHQELVDAEVTGSVIFVEKITAENVSVPCLKLHGAAALAVIRLTSKKQKVHVNHDFEITIDACAWAESSPEKKRAILDHELTHVHLRRHRQTNEISRDDTGRPRLYLKPDDFSLTGFYEIATRHGINAAEAESVERVHRRMAVALQLAADTAAPIQESAENEPTEADQIANGGTNHNSQVPTAV